MRTNRFVDPSEISSTSPSAVMRCWMLYGPPCVERGATSRLSRWDFSPSGSNPWGRPQATDDVLLLGDLRGEQWQERWREERRQQVHHTRPWRANRSLPSTTCSVAEVTGR